MRSGTPSSMILSCCFGELREGYVDGQVVVFGEREKFFELVCVGGRVPAGDRAIANGFGFVGDDAVHVGGDDVAEAFAFGAGAQRAIEVEELRLGVGEIEVAGFAAEGGAEGAAAPGAVVDWDSAAWLGDEDDARAVAGGEGGFDRFAEALGIGRRW